MFHMRKQFMLVSALVVLACAAHAATVDEMLAKFPGQNGAATEAACAVLVDAGAPALGEVCARILPESSGEADLAARYAVTGLAKYCGAPGRDAAKALFNQAVSAALGKAADPSVKAFFAVQLQWTGTDAEVPALAALLDDPATVEPGAAALEAIGSAAARDALKAKLASAPEACRARITAAIEMIDGVPAPPVSPATTAKDGPAVRAIALEALVREKGEKAADELAAAADDPDPEYRGAALLLTKRIPGKAGSAPWAKKLKRANDPAARAQIVAMLATRDDGAAEKAVLDALKDRDKGVRAAALETMSGTVAEKGLKTLFRMVEKPDSPKELTLAKNALVRSHGTGAVEGAAARYAKQCPCALADRPVKPALKQDPPEIRRAWLDIVAARGTEKHAPVAAGALQDGEGSVRIAAYGAVFATGGPAQVEPVWTAYMAALESAEETAARDTLAQITDSDPAARAGLLDKTAEQLATVPDGDIAKLTRLLSTLGGEAAAGLVAAAAAAPARAESVRAEAAQLLGGWSNPSGLVFAAALLDTQDAPALRGAALDAVCGQVKRHAAALDFGASVAPVAAKLRGAEEKRVFLKGLSQARVIGAARVIMPLLDDPEIAADAARALADAACMKNEKDRGLGEQDVLAALEKIAGTTGDEALRARIKAHLDMARKAS